MKVKEALKYGRTILAAAGIEDAVLEAEVLLRHVLKYDRVRLYLELNNGLGSADYDTFRQMLQRRTEGEPSAYITGHREFFGLNFLVDSRVLIPRPETEVLVEEALAIATKRLVSSIADIGTGSGAVVVSMASKLSKTHFYAVDISSPALEVAADNAGKHGVADRIHFQQGDLLEPLPGPVDLIVANLPYVKAADLSDVNTYVYEPALALDGGQDGLEVIRRLVPQVKSKLKPGGALLIEIGAGQGSDVTELLADAFPFAELKLISDNAGIDRVVSMVPRTLFCHSVPWTAFPFQGRLDTESRNLLNQLKGSFGGE